MITWHFKSYIKQSGFEWEIKTTHKALSWNFFFCLSVFLQGLKKRKWNIQHEIQNNNPASYWEKIWKDVITCAYVLPENKVIRAIGRTITIITTPNNISMKNNYGPKSEPCRTPCRLIISIKLNNPIRSTIEHQQNTAEHSRIHHYHQNTTWGNEYCSEEWCASRSTTLLEPCRSSAKPHRCFCGSSWWPNISLRHFLWVFPLIYHPSLYAVHQSMGAHTCTLSSLWIFFVGLF